MNIEDFNTDVSDRHPVFIPYKYYDKLNECPSCKNKDNVCINLLERVLWRKDDGTCELFHSGNSLYFGQVFCISPHCSAKLINIFEYIGKEKDILDELIYRWNNQNKLT